MRCSTTQTRLSRASTRSTLMATESILTLKTQLDATLLSLESTTVRPIFGSRTIFQWIPTAVALMIEQNISTTPTPKTIHRMTSCQTISITTVSQMLLRMQLAQIGAIPIPMGAECLMVRNVLNNSGSSIASERPSISSIRRTTFHKTTLSSGPTTPLAWSILTSRSIGESTPTTFQPETRTHTTTQFTQPLKWFLRSPISPTWQAPALQTTPLPGKSPTTSLSEKVHLPCQPRPPTFHSGLIQL